MGRRLTINSPLWRRATDNYPAPSSPTQEESRQRARSRAISKKNSVKQKWYRSNRWEGKLRASQNSRKRRKRRRTPIR